MTNGQRIKDILLGLFIIALSALLVKWPDKGINLICLIICFVLLAMGIRSLWFYFTMGRHMVGGKNTLYAGIILFDLGLFAFSVTMSKVFVILYLLGFYAFAGIVDMLLALDARKIDSGSWKLNFVTGLGNLAFAAAAIVFGFVIGDEKALVDLYAAGLLYSGLLKIINAFRKTDIVYIQ